MLSEMKFSMPMLAVVVALISRACCAGEAEVKPWRFVGELTYEERVAASPRNTRSDRELLALPFPHASNILPEPVILNAGALAIDSPGYDIDKVVWRTIPKTDAVEKYLQKKKEMPGAKAMELVDWCEKNALPECAEYELRRMLQKFTSFQQAGYAPIKDRWLKHADKRQVEYSFPLPLKGEWHVVPDKTGHHRMKAGAAYAFDMVLMQNGSMFKTHPSKLENYYAWGQPIIAQADGIVSQVVDDKPDVAAGQVGGFEDSNYVTVDYGGGIVGLYAHTQKGSAKVKAGDRVKAGQELARVGNSGASGFPHLHFTLYDHGTCSIKGRFRVEVQRGTKWELVDGENLKEGATVRNPQ
jgi:hypothetical protein